MIKAVIFDMDGVISDTQPLHSKVEEALLREYGVRLPASEITARFAGYSDKQFYEEVFAEHGVTNVNPADAIREVWERKFAAAKGNVKPIPGVENLVRSLKKRGMKLAVASASVPEFIRLVLSELGLEECFDAVTSSVEVEKGKPAPDIFLLAAKKLGVPPKECVVIEDGRNGMVAAKKAGMKCIGLVEKDGDYPADLLIRNFSELKADDDIWE
jgi:beta-phosphoglucomutase family hydrolase